MRTKPESKMTLNELIDDSESLLYRFIERYNTGEEMQEAMDSHVRFLAKHARRSSAEVGETKSDRKARP